MFDIDKAMGHLIDGMLQDGDPRTSEEDAYARIIFPREAGNVSLSDVRVQMRR